MVSTPARLSMLNTLFGTPAAFLRRCAIAIGDEHAHGVDRGQPVPGRERDDQLPTKDRRRGRGPPPAPYGQSPPARVRPGAAERIKYAIRLPANQVLQNRIGYLLKRPVGRPPNEVRRFHANFSYQAGSWTKPRRVIAKVEWDPGELYRT
jgi:Transposase DDE domain group 1